MNECFPPILQSRSKRRAAALPKRRAVAILAACLVLVAALGWIDYITGPQIGFFLFYIVPVVLAAWCAGGWFGCLVGLASAVAWFKAETAWSVSYSSPLIPYWNAATRLFIFLAMA